MAKLKYFLDHPQIKRAKSVGNGNKPGTLAEKINWGGKNTPDQPQPKSKTKSKSSGDKSGGLMSGIKSLFGGK